MVIIMKTLIYIVLFTLIAASSVHAKGEYGTFVDDPYKPFDATHHEYETMEITWKVASNVTKECNKMRVRKGYKPFEFEVNACSFWDSSECLIITKTKPTMHSLGHEIRHCFEKDWH